MNQGAGAEDAGKESKLLREEGGGCGYPCRAAGRLKAETVRPTQPSPVSRATCGKLGSNHPVTGVSGHKDGLRVGGKDKMWIRVSGILDLKHHQDGQLQGQGDSKMNELGVWGRVGREMYSADGLMGGILCLDEVS